MSASAPAFWDWALKAYALPDAAPACLELQDSHRQSVPYLLWAAWAAGGGRALPLEVLRAGSLLAAGWEQAAVTHLRAARRALKAPAEGVPDAVRLALRAEVRALELKAEQALMQALEALVPGGGAQPVPMRAALERAIGAWSFPAPAAAVERLAEALSSGAP